MQESPNRSVPIDCLRGLAVLLVVEYHFVPLWILRKGNYGVLLFFVISGYCISFSAETSRSGWHFFGKRLARLMPALLVCSLVTVTLKHLFPQLTDADRLISWWDYGYSLIGIPTMNVLQQHLALPDGAYWSLAAEFNFYLSCFGIMVIGLRKHLLPLLCLLAVAHTLTGTSSGATDYSPFFIAGVAIAALAEGKRREAIAALCFAVSLDLYHLAFHFGDASVVIVPSRTAFFWLSTAAVYLASIYHPTPRMRMWLAPLSALGLISYPLYLIHQDVGNMLIRWAGIPMDGIGLYERGFGVVGLMIFIAWLIHYAVERNAMRAFAVRSKQLMESPAAIALPQL